MPTLLHIDVSPRGPYSTSKQLSAAAVDAWKAKNPSGKVIERDLATTPLTFVDIQWIMGAYTPEDQRAPEHKNALALSDELIAELLSADEIVIGTPMYNFAVPAAFKAWIDHVVRVGLTFKYGETGPVGLVPDKKLVVIVASGGNYDSSSQLAFLNHEVPYLKTIFGFIGITDVTFVQAGGTMAVTQQKVTAEAFNAPYVEQLTAAV